MVGKFSVPAPLMANDREQQQTVGHMRAVKRRTTQSIRTTSAFDELHDQQSSLRLGLLSVSPAIALILD